MNRLLAGLIAAWLAAGCAPVERTSLRAVQGDVLPDDIASEHSSPLRGRTVWVQGRVAQFLLFVSPEGTRRYGCIIEEPDKRADGGIAVAGLCMDLGTNRRIKSTVGIETLMPGDEVSIRGHVQEWDGTTSLCEPKLISHTVDKPFASNNAWPVDPPADRAEAGRYWERRESTRCVVPAGSVAQGGRKETWWGNASFVYLLPPDADALKRADPQSRRAFRDAHPLDDRPDELFDNGNGFIVCLGDAGLKASTEDGTVKLPAVMTGDVLAHAVTGAVLQSHGEYLVHVDRMPVFAPGDDPVAAPPPFESGDEYIRIASYNVENLYDHRDDPFDARDFYMPATTPDEPRMLENYVPADDAAYRSRIAGLAAQIVGDLRAPDILMIQEVEDQDLPPADPLCAEQSF